MLQRTMDCGPEIKIKPNGQLLMDDKLEILIKGLRQKQNATIHTVIAEGGNIFESCSCFEADGNGDINLATHPSLSGSYTGVSPMGIFWGMVAAPGQKDGLRLTKNDTSTPMIAKLCVYDDHLSADIIHTSSLNPICSATVERWYKAQEVQRKVVSDGRLRGMLFLPPGEGPFPGVIDLFGTVGGLLEFRSALLASRGFASLSLAYFAFEDLPETLGEVDLDYFMEAIDWMCSHKHVFHDGIGVIGVSRGADLALLMAAYSEKVRCVVDINGCTFNQTYGLKFKDGFIPGVPIQLDKLYEENGAFVCKECWPHKKEDLTPIWKNDAKILAIVGLDDKLNPWQCNQLMKDNLPPEKSDNFQIVTYEGAGHLIEPPYTPLCSMSYHKSYNTKFWWGGRPEQHAFAQEDSWHRTLDHFNKYIPRTSNSDITNRSKL